MFKNSDNFNLANPLATEEISTTIKELISINTEIETILDKMRIIIFTDDIFYKKFNQLENLETKINTAENKIELLLKDIKHDKNEQFEKRWENLIKRTHVLQNLSCDVLIDSNFNNVEVYAMYKKISEIIAIYDSLLNKYSLKDLIIKINNELQTINETLWNTDNTYQEVHNWITNKNKKITNEEINFKFLGINKLNEKLSVGDNVINFLINIINFSEQMTLKIHNVILSESDSFKFINNIFNSVIDFSLYSTNTYNDLLKLIEIKIKQNPIIKISFKLSLINKRNENKLDPGKNKRIEIKITFPKNSYNFTVLIAEIKGGIEQFDFNKINKIITNKTTDHKYNDILNEIKKRLEVLSKFFTVELINASLDNYLTVGDKDLSANIFYEGIAKKITFNIKNIKLSTRNLKEKVEQFLDQTFNFDFNENFNESNLITSLNNELRKIFKNEDFNRIKINNYNSKKEFINDNGQTFSKLKIIIDSVEVIKEIKFMINFSEHELEKRVKTFFKQTFNFYLTANDTINSFVLKLNESFKKAFGEKNQKRVVITGENLNSTLKQENKIIVYHNFQIKIGNSISKIMIKTELMPNIANLKIQLEEIFKTAFIFNDEYTSTELINKIWATLILEFGEKIKEVLTISYLKKVEDDLYVYLATHHISILFENEKIRKDYKIRVEEKFSKEKLKNNLSQFLENRFFFNELNENANLKSMYEAFLYQFKQKVGQENAKRVTIDRINETAKIRPNNKGETYWDLKFYIDHDYVFNKNLTFSIKFSRNELKSRLSTFLDKRIELNLRITATLKETLEKWRTKLIDQFGNENAKRITTNREYDTARIEPNAKGEDSWYLDFLIDKEKIFSKHLYFEIWFNSTELKSKLESFLNSRFELDILENATLKSTLEEWRTKLIDQFGSYNANRITTNRENESTKITPNDKGEDSWNLNFSIDKQVVFNKNLDFIASFSKEFLKDKLWKFLDQRHPMNVYEFPSLKKVLEHFKELLKNQFGVKNANRITTDRQNDETVTTPNLRNGEIQWWLEFWVDSTFFYRKNLLIKINLWAK